MKIGVVDIKQEDVKGMINRDDMLELTRRMTPARASVGRIAGAYFDEEGYVDGTFNTNFLKLSASERTRNLNMAKTVLISKTNEQLKEYRITKEMGKPGSVWQLLDGVKESEMKYDVPVKGTDKEWLEGSEEVYTYLLCVISPLTGEYEPGTPEFGFLYPAFKDRSTGWEFVNVYEKLPERVHREWMEWLFK